MSFRALLSLLICVFLPLCSLAQQLEDAWSDTDCFSKFLEHPLLQIEGDYPGTSSDTTVFLETFNILENFRGEFWVQWNSPLRSDSKERILHSTDELESHIHSILLSTWHSVNGDHAKNSFTYNRSPDSVRPCSSVIRALIRALESARDELAQQKIGLTMGELKSACHNATHPVDKRDFLSVFHHVEEALPPFQWKRRNPLNMPPDNPFETEEEDIPFMIVEEMPGFGPCANLSGQERDQCTQIEITKYISTYTKYPPIAKDAGIQGTVFVYFVVGKDGKVRDCKVLRPVDPRLDEEALRVVQSFPDFEPGRQQGKPVSVQYTTAVKFINR